ncbi:MAG: hypothetical protein JNL08_01725 [Planctomycetes bacterium]|nr:hypothetical protein [Planctomycetota bacterium]
MDLALVFTLLISAQIAAGWGELCGIRPGHGKSGLGGFAAMWILFVIRWGALAIGLLAVGAEGERIWLLGGHTLLGLASSRLFQRCVDRVARDHVAPQALGWLAAVVLPTPAAMFVALRGNAIWSGDSAAAASVYAVAIAALHFACYTSRRNDMLRPARPQPATH